MKKIIYLSAIIIAMIFVGTSCHKYEEGGYASKGRLCKTWKLVKTQMGSVEITENGATSIIFDKEGKGEIKFSSAQGASSINFKWEWAEEKDGVNISYDNILFGEIFPIGTSTIVKLTTKELWLKRENIVKKFEKQ